MISQPHCLPFSSFVFKATATLTCLPSVTQMYQSSLGFSLFAYYFHPTWMLSLHPSNYSSPTAAPRPNLAKAISLSELSSKSISSRETPRMVSPSPPPARPLLHFNFLAFIDFNQVFYLLHQMKTPGRQGIYLFCSPFIL